MEIPILRLKKIILGKNYNISFAYVSPKKSKELNRIYRHQNKPTDILAFPYSKKEGEILICRSIARKKAKSFGKKYEQYLGFLVIHGMLHLRGYRHGSIMEEKERKLAKRFGF